MTLNEHDQKTLDALPATRNELARILNIKPRSVEKRIHRLKELGYPVHSVYGEHGWRYEILPLESDAVK